MITTYTTFIYASGLKATQQSSSRGRIVDASFQVPELQQFSSVEKACWNSVRDEGLGPWRVEYRRLGNSTPIGPHPDCT